MTFPPCPGCGEPAMDGHITCGKFECDERATRVIREQTGTRTTHIVIDGKLLCGEPMEDVFAVTMARRRDATCVVCSVTALAIEQGDSPTNDERARELIARADRGEGRADVKLVADYLRRKPTTLEAQPGEPPRLGAAKSAAIGGLFAAEGRTLLQLLFAWRAQGSLARWSTGPSKALALFVDFLQREYPTASAAARTNDLDFVEADESEIEP